MEKKKTTLLKPSKLHTNFSKTLLFVHEKKNQKSTVSTVILNWVFKAATLERTLKQ